MNLFLLIFSTLQLAVTIVEDASDGTPGAQKEDAALAQFKAALTAALGTYPAWIPDIFVRTAIRFIVEKFNKIGWFQKKGVINDKGVPAGGVVVPHA